MIGDKVKVIVDRPLGSSHPKYPDLVYPINYGYIEGIVGGDGEWQDAYVLGIDVPVSEFHGVVIAVIHRKNDCEDKWVVAPNRVSFTRDEIKLAVHFQEQYFKSEILM
ncbi:MAG: inorganic pyrophosphatase [Ruminococcaceae bacterium]|nr:inorganic pyrophosphatase [Oscillospiraceae bacterium]